MGSTSGGGGGGGKRKYLSFRNKQRANKSFFIVVMFFAVFGIIIFTELFLIDEQSRGGGVLVRHGALSYNRRQEPDYDDAIQNEDYAVRGAPAAAPDDTVGALLMGQLPPAVPVHDDDSKVLTEAQLPPFPTNITPADGVWQTVGNTRFKFYVFSAFLDNRKGNRIVRVIGATKTRIPEHVWCRLWYRVLNGNATAYVSRTTAAKVKVIRENWNLKFSACFVLCPMQPNQTAPFAVSVVAKIRAAPVNLITVVNNYNESKPPQKFGICVKPLHFDYNRALQILEFIELNRILGVEHFTFYNHTLGPQVNCILQDYEARGLITILPWQLNLVSQKEIRTEGLFAALNDCLYRSMYRFSHVLLIDLDEFIIPKREKTLPQLIEYLNTKVNTRIATASYSFQNAFFYLQWSDDESAAANTDPIATNLVTLTKTRRKSKLHPHKQRSKYICRPELVVEAGNHFVWEFIPGHGTLSVPAESAILHHYRICEFGGDDCVKTASTVDTTAFRHREALVEAVRKRYDGLNGRCELEAVSPSISRALKATLADSDSFKIKKLR